MRPVRLLAAAADRLGRDVNAPPLGTLEVAARRAFNQMAERIRRFVADRTQMLAAILDLRTRSPGCACARNSWMMTSSGRCSPTSMRWSR